MSTIEVSGEALAAAREEAARRGVAVSEVVNEAVRRFTGGADLHRLLGEFRRLDAASPTALTDDEAQRVANEELDAVRKASSADC